MGNWLPFLSKKNNKIKDDFKLVNPPEHVAIIMDGNGRWAKKKKLPRIAGHKEGMDTVRNIVKAAVEFEIQTLTLYAFSTENWKRPRPEVEFLMKLPKEFLNIYLPEMIENNVKIETIGELDPLPQYTKNAILNAIEKTKDNDGLLLNFAMNYGSRGEILHAVKEMYRSLEANNQSIDEIDEEQLCYHLYTSHIKDPDLLIRTSGEKRLSNFLLWQSAYTELYFTDVLWPDFTPEVFKEALINYQSRIRRYGGL